MDKNRRNYYRILQVQPDAPQAVIKASYRALMQNLRHHPDLGGDTWLASVINEAYSTLSDEQKRQAYDAELFSKYSKFDVAGHPAFKHAVKGDVTSDAHKCHFCHTPFELPLSMAAFCEHCGCPLCNNIHNEFKCDATNPLLQTQLHGHLRCYTSPLGPGKTVGLQQISPQGLTCLSEDNVPIGQVVKLESSLLIAAGRVTDLKENIIEGFGGYQLRINFLTVIFKRVSGNFVRMAV